jgi:hypothetical protein
MTLTGEVLEADEPNALACTWGEETLRFELSAAGDGGTRLVLVDELPAAARRVRRPGTGATDRPLSTVRACSGRRPGRNGACERPSR